MILLLPREKSNKFLSTPILLLLLAVIIVFSSCENKEAKIHQKIKYFNEIESSAFLVQGKEGDSKSFAFLDSIQKNDPEAGEISQIIRLEFLANSYLATGKLDSAKFYIDQVVPILYNTATVDEIPKEYAKAYFLLNDIYFARKNYLEAYKWLYLGRQIADKNLNICDMAQFNYRIGIVFFNQENYKEAAKTFLESFKQSANCDSNFRSFYRRQEILNDAAFSYFKAGEIDSALFYYDKVINLLLDNEERFKPQKNYFKVAKGVVFGNMGQAENAKGNFDLAIQLLQSSIAINDQKGNDQEDAFLQKINLAKAYVNANKLNQFEILSKNIIPGLDTLKRIKSQSNFYKITSDYYLLRKDTAKAYQNLRSYYRLNEKLQKQDKALNQININEQLNYIENQDNYTALKKTESLKSIYLTTAIILFTMTLAIIVLIYFYWKKSKKTVKILSELNEKINKQSQELKLKNLEKDQILRIVAHDLRNPIGGICSISRLMKMEDLDSSELEMVDMIESASNDALLLISEILEFTEDGNNKIPFEKTSVQQILSTSVALLKFKTDEKKQTIVLNKPDEDVFIFANREKISRVVSNLIVNASKFSHTETLIYVNAKIENQHIIISIEDQGIGIPEHLQSEIFKPFAVTKRKGTVGEKSFGMGLSICQQIIALHNGEIGFTSSPSGSIFFIKLPLIKPLKA
ncbi:tetratricopeptide repeat-containing sensor histidine kinase [Pedobacter cryophilus]|uniref:histidine kinase n=1 Tax=Pedobacter cryophilus TaxID=2571271 RepID=A0A4U1BUM5_9SPHI|nr:HAMP domain-containing sensor histidine kinase [Pedobacter cryophilus]TKB95608.1 HAMP domain-containing histidine kinase [Pedobacter cryophilus]